MTSRTLTKPSAPLGGGIDIVPFKFPRQTQEQPIERFYTTNLFQGFRDFYKISTCLKNLRVGYSKKIWILKNLQVAEIKCIIESPCIYAGCSITRNVVCADSIFFGSSLHGTARAISGNPHLFIEFPARYETNLYSLILMLAVHARSLFIHPKVCSGSS